MAEADDGVVEFVEGWIVTQVLGEGAYGEVRLLVHARSGGEVALKTVRAEGAAGGAAARREAALHRALRHPHVLRCLGERAHPPLHYMFLEYAQGGELFDRIEPDVGMPERQARRYWSQLLGGLQYLHGRGVAHRDIKPENLLLDSDDNIKISDFGMATLFRHGSRERLLSRVCGTLTYAAPEVMAAPERPYRAPPADLWSAAVVLLAMLTGEIPWECANASDGRYAEWAASYEDEAGGGAGVRAGWWRKVRGEARAALRLALHPAPPRRAPLRDLRHCAWLQQGEQRPARPRPEGVRLWSSQPARGGAGADADAEAGAGAGAGAELSAADMDALVSYSQPALADDLLLSTSHEPASQGAPHGGGGVLQRLVRRMTRVWVRGDEAGALAALCRELRARHHVWRRLHARELAVECGPEVRMRVRALRARAAGAGAGAGAGAAGEPRVVLDFRRSRGCGLQFKRYYRELRDALQDVAAPPPAEPLADLLAEPLDAAAATESMDLS